MKSVRRKRCKECNAFGTLSKEEKCGACRREENEETSSQCDRCESAVEEGQDGVCCEVCRGWFHAKCEGVSERRFEELQDSEEEPWWCKKCITLAMKNMEASRRLREEKEEWKVEQQKYDAEVKELREQMGVLERENKLLKEETEQLKSLVQKEKTQRRNRVTQADHTYYVGQQAPEVTVGSSQGAPQEETGQPDEHVAEEDTAAREDTQSGRQEEEATVRGEEQPRTQEDDTTGRETRQRTNQDQEEEEEEAAAQRGGEQDRQQAVAAAAADTWVGVGVQSWKKIAEGKRFYTKTSGKLQRRLWLFGDSLLRGVGREIHFLSRGYYTIMDRSEPGANVHEVKKIVEEHLAEIGQEDLVVLEGGGNGLIRIGNQETLEAYEEMAKMVSGKVKRKPLIVGIPMRRGREASMFGEKRRGVNRRMMEKLEEWSCDGLQLWERMSWREVWGRDGIHMSKLGKAWMAWNVVEWAQHREGDQA